MDFALTSGALGVLRVRGLEFSGLQSGGRLGGVPGPMQACHRPFAGLHEVAGKQQADVEGSEMGGQPHRTLFGL